MTHPINEWYLLMLLVGHFFADFVLQTDAQAKNKSKDIRALLSHTLSYSFVLGGFSVWMVGVKDSITFVAITFAAHTLTDYITSRMVRPRFEKGDYHNAFVIIGFDQMLHYVQLYLTLKLLLP